MILLTSASKTLFNDSKSKNYFSKKLNFYISNA